MNTRMNFIEKSLLLIFALIMIQASFCIHANAEEVTLPISGKSGDLDWSIDEDGLLTISGEGDYDRVDDCPPWCEYSEYIESAEVAVTDITDTSYMFYYCSNLKFVELGKLDTAQVTDMSMMFCGCNNLESLDLLSFNTSKVMSMTGMFAFCSRLLYLDLDGFIINEDTDVSGMVDGCRFREITIPAGVKQNIDFSCAGVNYRIIKGGELWKGPFYSHWVDEDGNKCTSSWSDLDYSMTYYQKLIIDEGEYGSNAKWVIEYSFIDNCIVLYIYGKGEIDDYTGIDENSKPWKEYSPIINKTVLVETDDNESVDYDNYDDEKNEATNDQNNSNTQTITEQPQEVSNINDLISNNDEAVDSIKQRNRIISNGAKVVINDETYKVLSLKNSTVSFASSSDKKSSVTIPSAVKIEGKIYMVTKIENDAFKNNTVLKNVTIGSIITEIGAGAFQGCKNLTSVRIGNGVTTIGNNAFEGCKALKSITFEKNVTRIGKKAFYNCKSLKKIHFKTTKLKSVGAKAFKNINKNYKVKVKKKYAKKYMRLTKGKIG